MQGFQRRRRPLRRCSSGLAGLVFAVGLPVLVGVCLGADPVLIESVARDPNSGQVSLTFSSDTQHLYQIQVITNRVAIGVPNVISLFIGETAATAWTDPEAPVSPTEPCFYRVVRFTFAGDPDGDALASLAEFQGGTDPGNPDTDGDVLRDGWEVMYGFDPLSAAGDDGGSGDPDGDGMTNAEEQALGRNPLVGALPDAGGVIGLEVYTPWEAE